MGMICEWFTGWPHHAQDVEALVRGEQVHVEEVFEAHLVVRLLVVLVLVYLPYYPTGMIRLYVCMYLV